MDPVNSNDASYGDIVQQALDKSGIELPSYFEFNTRTPALVQQQFTSHTNVWHHDADSNFDVDYSLTPVNPTLGQHVLAESSAYDQQDTLFSDVDISQVDSIYDATSAPKVRKAVSI